jgi:hypothetical protein
MNNEAEVAVAAGALAAAILDSLVAKGIFTKDEAGQVIANAHSRVGHLKSGSSAAVNILAAIGSQIATNR